MKRRKTENSGGYHMRYGELLWVQTIKIYHDWTTWKIVNENLDWNLSTRVFNYKTSKLCSQNFPLRASSANETKSSAKGGFGNIYWRNPSWKTSCFVLCWAYDVHISFYNSSEQLLSKLLESYNRSFYFSSR